MKKIKSKIIVTLLIAESAALLCIILCHFFDVSVSVEKRTKKDIHNDVILPANETATEKPLTEDNTFLYKYTVDANAVYIDGYLGNEINMIKKWLLYDVMNYIMQKPFFVNY